MKKIWILFSIFFPVFLGQGDFTYGQQTEWPAVEDLPVQAGLPDPLVMFNGLPVTSLEQWEEDRRPELIALFEHYMYGKAPAPPKNFSFVIEDVDHHALGGKATRKIVTLTFCPDNTPPVSLLVVVPNNKNRPSPVFLGLNAAGNHALMDDPLIPLTKAWIKNSYFKNTNDNRAHDSQRGTRTETWQIEKAIDRGYGVVTLYAGEISPDYDGGYLDGVHKSYFGEGQEQPRPDEWGVLAAWAWGLQRGVDYIMQDKDLDSEAIIVTGHSRRGKAALLAGAFDERIAIVIPHQAGCGGTSPSRSDVGESVAAINTSFPHWFNGNFKQFNDQVERLPFDQHSLLALVAPRPLLLTNATEDTWADPEGQFDMLKAINPVYHLYGKKGIEVTDFPKENDLIDSEVGYFIRPGKHAMGASDWESWLNFCDKHLQK